MISVSLSNGVLPSKKSVKPGFSFLGFAFTTIAFPFLLPVCMSSRSCIFFSFRLLLFLLLD